MEKYRIVICGGRHFNGYEQLKTTITNFLKQRKIEIENVEIVSGHCQGADMLGEQYAKEYGLNLTIFPADWQRYKRKAGPIRNKQMIEYIMQTENKAVIAFVSENSKGTKQTVLLAKRVGIFVVETHYSISETGTLRIIDKA